jgi:CCR4-NOT transcription complex subunit 7/8
MSPPSPEGLTGLTAQGDTLRVREVWACNLDAELEILRNAVEKFPFCAMDTEFPGVVAR